MPSDPLSANEFDALANSLLETSTFHILHSQEPTLNPLRPSVRNARQNPGPPTHIISNDIHQKMAKAINSAWATSTLGKYSNSVHLFLKFCTSQGIAHNYCLPASEFLLCAFAASIIGMHTATTARGNLSAVCAWHIANNHPYAGQHSLRFSYTLKGIENA